MTRNELLTTPVADTFSSVPPICYRGREYAATKHFLQGMHRVCSPEETLARIKPCFPAVGLTRLADITGLDRVGIPVVLAVRPNAGYLAVDAGKGLTLMAATVSAGMETIERYHGETTTLPEIILPYAELTSCGCHVVPVENFPFTRHNIFSVHQPEHWVLGWDIANQQEVAVPSTMVFMKRFKWPRSELHPFQATSNGLASGNHLLEAIESGLLEVIERDATTTWQLALEACFTRIPLPRIRLDTVEHPMVCEVLARLEAAQVIPILYDFTVDTQVPTYMAWIYDETSRNMGAFKGYGAHLDPEVAMLRALTEAIQSRLIYIAGARDDAFRHVFNLLKKADSASIRERFLDRIPAIADAHERVSEASPTLEGDIRLLVEKLHRVGLEQVIVCDLTLPGFDVHIVRVIVPGLEGYKGMNFFKPGYRAIQFVRRLAEEIERES